MSLIARPNSLTSTTMSGRRRTKRTTPTYSPTATFVAATIILCSCWCSWPDCALAASRLSSRTITTRYGALKGLLITPEPVSADSETLPPIEAYLGVPYASPPTGAMRFMPPGTPQHWKGIRMADRLGPACPQRPPDVTNETEALRKMPPHRLEHLRRLSSFLVGPDQQSEDCLYLNLYTPAVGSYLAFGRCGETCIAFLPRGGKGEELPQSAGCLPPA